MLDAMIKRFCTICVVIGAALLALSVLGVVSLKMHERGLRAERQGQFVSVAEQIRLDVKNELDAFLQAEQRRPYTDYQYAYVPEMTLADDALVRSPLANSLTHGMAFGHFQIDGQGNMTMPYAQAALSQQKPDPALSAYMHTVQTRVVEVLRGHAALYHPPSAPLGMAPTGVYEKDRAAPSDEAFVRLRQQRPAPDDEVESTQRAPATRARTYPIESLQKSQAPQRLQQTRGTAMRNVAMTAPKSAEADTLAFNGTETHFFDARRRLEPENDTPRPARSRSAASPDPDDAEIVLSEAAEAGREDQEIVDIRIEPLVPLVVAVDQDAEMFFPGWIFLIRHVQIENTRLLQGFRFNEAQLVEQVRLSARRLLREGMDFELDRIERPEAVHTAILDFGFGGLALNLLETEPGRITTRAARLNTWLTGMLIVVWLTVMLAMMGLWRNLHEQISLARQKDDFISAVSHELRTPLTSIRMYTEMLEKGWVKEEAKKRTYYGTMRQETERLSRLIENVLDFSRIQRGKKHYDFTLGDVNTCVREVVEMMRPCAEKNGFVIETDLPSIEPFAFDRDAVMQILINLIDNALKYAKDTRDKRIVVRTVGENDHAVIEVEDHGPGISKTHQDRIFEAFYRCDNESVNQANGAGLGLALVKRFAHAHQGLVEVMNASAGGTVFRVYLARQTEGRTALQ